MRPLRDLVIVAPREVEKVTAGGIILTKDTTEKNTATTGIVISVGEQVSDVKEGDEVAYNKYAGTVVEFRGEKRIFLKEDTILGII